MAKKCSNCNNLIDDTAAFCDICGTPFPAGSRGGAVAAAGTGGGTCPGCGAQNQPGEAFCNNCGLQLPPVIAQSPVDSSKPDAAPAVAEVTGRLVIPGTKHAFDLPSGKPELLIGRSEPDSRFFPDIDTTAAGGQAAGVSRRHAKLTIAGGRIYIEDLGSTNFTFVNRQRLQMGQRVPLNPGDEVRLGRLVMLYHA